MVHIQDFPSFPDQNKTIFEIWAVQTILTVTN